MENTHIPTTNATLAYHMYALDNRSVHITFQQHMIILRAHQHALYYSFLSTVCPWCHSDSCKCMP